MISLHLLCIYLLSITSTLPLYLPHSMLSPASSTGALSSTSHLASSERRVRCDFRLGHFCTLIICVRYHLNQITKYFEAAQAARGSCINVMNKISPWSRPVIFGSRTVEVKDVTVPLRYLSDDGLCAIDVTFLKGTSADVANGVGLLHAARTIWEECAIPLAAGGTTSGFCR